MAEEAPLRQPADRLPVQPEETVAVRSELLRLPQAGVPMLSEALQQRARSRR